jgi:large exoprotein involved in heme utilization and adhesion
MAPLIVANPLGDLESGGITIKAVDSVIVRGVNSLEFPSSILNEVDIEATSDAGFMTIDTGRLLIEDGGVISVGTFGAGDSGKLIVNARESVEMRGQSPWGNAYIFIE